MKLSLWLIFSGLIAVSCVKRENVAVAYTINDKIVTIKSDNTTLNVDNNLNFEVLYNKDAKRFTLTEKDKSIPSVYIHDSINERITFRRKSAQADEISDKFGKGKILKIEALSTDSKIKCILSISSYNKFPGVVLVQSLFINISEKIYSIKDYSLNQIFLHPPSVESVWWSFQGASYHWGDDFVFKLPETFSRENYMGINAIKTGGGLPFVDVWNKQFGLALVYLGEKPGDICLPVNVETGRVSLGIKETNKNEFVEPGDTLFTVQTAIIVHKNDFYDPLKMYSALTKPLLPDFQKPVEYAYQPEWCTWGYRQDFRPEQILGNLDRLKALGIRSVILDDGWSLNHGDWIPDPKKFPDGEKDFKQLINKIHESGMKVWIWWVPGYADSISSLVSQHPDWLIKNKDGSVNGSYGLCPAYQPVQEHYSKLVQKFVEEFKIDGFKLDFREINSAPPCYNSKHNHKNAFESFYSTPLLFKNIYETAKRYNPNMLIEYCSCGIPPTIFHLPWTNLAVTSDPDISQITNRIKMYKALRGDDFPVLEEYCGVLAGPLYQLTIGAGGVPGTFSTRLDNFNEKWMNIYQKYQLSKGEYLNLYDIAFDYPEAHVIKKNSKFYYAFYTHPWKQLGSPERLFRFGKEFDHDLDGKTEFKFPDESYSGFVNFRGLNEKVKYKIVDYENNKELGILNGDKPSLQVSFDNYLLLELSPQK